VPGAAEVRARAPAEVAAGWRHPASWAVVAELRRVAVVVAERPRSVQAVAGEPGRPAAGVVAVAERRHLARAVVVAGPYRAAAVVGVSGHRAWVAVVVAERPHPAWAVAGESGYRAWAVVEAELHPAGVVAAERPHPASAEARAARAPAEPTPRHRRSRPPASARR